MKIWFWICDEKDGYLFIEPLFAPEKEISRQFQSWEDFVAWYEKESDDVGCEAFTSPLYHKTVEVIINH